MYVSDDNEKVKVIKGALKNIISKISDGTLKPEEGKKFPEIKSLEEALENFVTMRDLVKTLQIFGIDAESFIISDYKLDPYELGMATALISRSVIAEKARTELSGPLKLLYSLRGLREPEALRIYLYKGRYYVYEEEKSEKRKVFDHLTDVFVYLGIFDRETVSEIDFPISGGEKVSSGKLKDSAPDTPEEIINGKKKTIKFVIIQMGEDCSELTSLQIYSALRNIGLLRESDRHRFVTKGRERCFYVRNSMGTEELKELCRRHSYPMDIKLFYWDSGAEKNIYMKKSPSEPAYEWKKTELEEMFLSEIESLEVSYRIADDMYDEFYGGVSRKYDDYVYDELSGSVRPRHGSKGKLIYGCGREGLVFMKEKKALELSRLKNFIRDGKHTWSDFRHEYPDRYYAVMENYPEEDEFDSEEEYEEDCMENPRPDDNDPIDEEILPGFYDGDYYEWPAQLMLEFMPVYEIPEEYGRVVSSVFNGDYLELKTEYTKEILIILEHEGFITEENDDLVWNACS